MTIDKKKAMHTFGISESDYDELLFEFVEIAGSKLAQLEKMLDSNDFENASACIHSIKGMAGNMQLDDCYSTAVSIELEVNSGKIENVKALLDKIRAHIREISTAIGDNPVV